MTGLKVKQVTALDKTWNVEGNPQTVTSSHSAAALNDKKFPLSIQ